jgi:acetyltransferase-like isoleucine patch superfamily enzyme
MNTLKRLHAGFRRRLQTLCWRLWLHSRVGGRVKLRGDLSRLEIDSSFRCVGDLWLGIHSDHGEIRIAQGVSASGPLVITAIERVVVGRGVLLGPNVMVTDHYHGDPQDPSMLDIAPSARALHSRGPILIGDFVQIGANVSILSPTSIGSNAVVGANSVVRGELATRTVHVGAPARPLQSRQQHGTK